VGKKGGESQRGSRVFVGAVQCRKGQGIEEGERISSALLCGGNGCDSRRRLKTTRQVGPTYRKEEEESGIPLQGEGRWAMGLKRGWAKMVPPAFSLFLKLFSFSVSLFIL
jgi:hypothetical protein